MSLTSASEDSDTRKITLTLFDIMSVCAGPILGGQGPGKHQKLQKLLNCQTI